MEQITLISAITPRHEVPSRVVLTVWAGSVMTQVINQASFTVIQVEVSSPIWAEEQP